MAVLIVPVHRGNKQGEDWRWAPDTAQSEGVSWMSRASKCCVGFRPSGRRSAVARDSIVLEPTTTSYSSLWVRTGPIMDTTSRVVKGLKGGIFIRMCASTHFDNFGASFVDARLLDIPLRYLPFSKYGVKRWLSTRPFLPSRLPWPSLRALKTSPEASLGLPSTRCMKRSSRKRQSRLLSLMPNISLLLSEPRSEVIEELHYPGAFWPWCLSLCFATYPTSSVERMSLHRPSLKLVEEQVAATIARLHIPALYSQIREGYRQTAAAVIGEEIAYVLEPVLGLDVGGEIRGVTRPSGNDKIWFHVGETRGLRITASCWRCKSPLS
uniref:Uncharacterized protein n=1 Tax=Mycena chlorophos TaxID=658473 RepID=A0ABQ0LZ25_MYCCL|nr:predicted protein [Mycena chlorophos]